MSSCRLFTGCRHRSSALLCSQYGFTDTLQGFTDHRNFCPYIPYFTAHDAAQEIFKAKGKRQDVRVNFNETIIFLAHNVSPLCLIEKS